MIIAFVVALWDYSYTFSTDVMYDNNIFTYSQEYIDDFLNQIRPYRFPFETYDDLKSSAELHLRIRNRFFDHRTTTFNIDVHMNHYLINHQKDYQRIDVGLRQSLGTYAVKAEYQIIPSYLIRYYRNPQGAYTDYRGCEVTYHSIVGTVSMQATPTLALDVSYRRKWDDYVSEFDIYDAKSHTIGVTSDITLHKRLMLSLGYALRIARVDATPPISMDREDTPDGSYNQHRLGADCTYTCMLLVPTVLTLGYAYTFRNFITPSPYDSLHYGRQDHMHNIVASTELKLVVGMLLKIAYTMRLRNATSEILRDIDRIKDYTTYNVSCGLSFYH
jgi:hypothetical protein